MPLFCWFVVLVAGNAVYIPLAEEPGLVKRFGDEYLAYKRNVPRSIPRMRGWEGPVGPGSARKGKWDRVHFAHYGRRNVPCPIFRSVKHGAAGRDNHVPIRRK